MIHALSGFSVLTLVLAPLIVLLGFTVLGVTGFGSLLTAVPLIAQLLPVRFAVPMLLVLDFAAAMIIGTKNRSVIAGRELLRIIPFMFVGIALGATVLVHAPEKVLLFALGLFVLGYATYSIKASEQTRPISPHWAVPMGTLGGLISTLFGTGGPLFVIYLARRISDKSALRATMTTVITISSVTRFVVFAAAGLYSQPHMLAAIIALSPFTLGGLWLGNYLHHRLSTKHVVQALWLILIIGGVSLIARSLL